MRLDGSSRPPLRSNETEGRSSSCSPALINRAWGRSSFWDGRVQTLEAQMIEPIEDPNEMDLPAGEAAVRAGRPICRVEGVLNLAGCFEDGNPALERLMMPILFVQLRAHLRHIGNDNIRHLREIGTHCLKTRSDVSFEFIEALVEPRRDRIDCRVVGCVFR